MEKSNSVRLEPIGYQHTAAIQDLASDPAIGKTSSVPSPYPSHGARTWISHAILRRLHGLEYSFAILADDRPIGVCAVVIIGEKRKGGEIGYWVGKPYWNRGYATIACRQLLEFCFEKLRLSWLTASILERNSASSRVLQKVGFSCIGRGINPSWKWGPRDSFLFFRLDGDDLRQVYKRQERAPQEHRLPG